MGLRIVQVDAFTDRAFGGNPAAVCVLPEPRDAAWMQAVAREMNLSETAFLRLDGDCYRLRWFTPAVEVDLCGHATLASAHVLWEDGHLAAGKGAAFHTRRGVMVTSRASSDGFDFVSRFFAPRTGVPEDPVTGSAHCALGPYWSERLKKKDLLAYQASARGGVLRVRPAGDRVILGGQAVTVLRAELAADD